MTDKTNINNTEETPDPSRRKFLKNTGMVVGGVAGGSILGGLITNQFLTNTTDKEMEDSISVPTEARMFFKRFEDFAVLEQATERIYPEDENGPGAIGLGVPYFIDKQLAGPWGMNGRDYRHGPFPDTSPLPNDSILTRGAIFLEGLRKMNQYSMEQFDHPFDKAEEEQQIEILQAFEAGDVNMEGATSDAFFTLLFQSVLEGAYSDPLYGGNRNMAGWKMKEYPGSVPSYTNIIGNEEFEKMNPISLTDYQQKN